MDALAVMQLGTFHPSVLFVELHTVIKCQRTAALCVCFNTKSTFPFAADTQGSDRAPLIVWSRADAVIFPGFELSVSVRWRRMGFAHRIEK